MSSGCLAPFEDSSNIWRILTNDSPSIVSLAKKDSPHLLCSKTQALVPPIRGPHLRLRFRRKWNKFFILLQLCFRASWLSEAVVVSRLASWQRHSTDVALMATAVMSSPWYSGQSNLEHLGSVVTTVKPVLCFGVGNVPGALASSPVLQPSKVLGAP